MSRPPALKIAFYGGMANNCYMVCKQMRASGVDAVLIRDRLDNYAISQPMWEDHRFSLSYEELVASSGWSPNDWDRLAGEKGWRQPDWIIDPLHETDEAEPDLAVLADDDLRTYVTAPADHSRKILAIMRRQDLIFVSNVYAIILALLSGRPFVICPAGGEFMIAAGVLRGEGDVGRTLDMQRRILLTAFARTRAVLTNTAYWQHGSLTGGVLPLVLNFPRARFKRVSLPFETEAPLTAEAKRDARDRLMAELECAPIRTRFSVFLPARIDFRWKGQDKLLEAIAKMKHSGEFTFIFAGWGSDYKALHEWSTERSNVRVLRGALSKPFLREMYQACDLTVDQFTLGHIGSASREAAAAGAPVMAWISGQWLNRLAGRPDLPVINVRTASAIARSLDAIATGDIDLGDLIRSAQDWVTRYSSPSLMHDALRRCAAPA